MSEELYTISDAARILEVSRQTLYTWINQGEVESVSLGNGRQAISQSTLDHLLKIIPPAEQRKSKTENYLLYEVVKKRRS